MCGPLKKFKTPFNEKFAVSDETGAFVYKADACAHRFDDISRDDMEMTRKDNWLATGTFGTKEYREENRNIAIAYELLARGHHKPTTETLEEWIDRHTKEEVEEETITRSK